MKISDINTLEVDLIKEEMQKAVSTEKNHFNLNIVYQMGKSVMWTFTVD